MSIARKLLMGAAGAGSKSTYIDDVFSTYLYDGDGSSSHTITNNIDLSDKGGMVWIKRRNGTYDNWLMDSVRGGTKMLSSNLAGAEATNQAITSFNTNGFTLGNEGQTNAGGTNMASWSFAKQKGFFDVVTWTGDGTAGRQIAHGLGSVPGCIMVKCSSAARDWSVYHRGLLPVGQPAEPWDYRLYLNGVNSYANQLDQWNDTEPTATHFTLGDSMDVNGGSKTYVAYIFAGANATKWSDMISPASGYFDQPAELAFNGLIQYHPNRLRTSGNAVLVTMTLSPAITIQSGQSVVVYGEDASVGNPYNYSGTATVTIDGTTYTSSTGDTHTFNHSGQLTQITYVNNSGSGRTYLEGIRVNGDLLTDGSFFVNGNPNYTAGEESKFGEDGDQSIIKCGNYKGTGSGGNNIHVGWQPQWILIKSTDNSENWVMFDTMRGIATSGDDQRLRPNNTDAESNGNWIDATSTGFSVIETNSVMNESNKNYLYIAIRSRDGYVGKPPEAGTDAFAMDGSGGGSGSKPAFTSGFTVDFALNRDPTAADSWAVGSRLTPKTYLVADTTAAEASSSMNVWDVQNGVYKDWNSSHQAWMWKRGAGFDVVCWKGNGVAGNEIQHNLSKVPEMIWVKVRNDVGDWQAYHKGLNGGTTPQNYFLRLNTEEAEVDSTTQWNDTAPTSTYFTLGNGNGVNNNNKNYIAMLFASVDGISKVGYYTGDGTNDGSHEITVGFQPRFLIIKCATGNEPWTVFDTTRGWVSGSDNYLRLNTNDAQSSGDKVDPTSTGFKLMVNTGPWNDYPGKKYIYYAHA